MPPAVAAIAGGAAALGGGIGGALINKSAADDALDAANQGRQGFLNLRTPNVGDQSLDLQKLQSAGELNPYLLQNQNVGNTQLSDIQTDPRLRQAQMDALNTLGNISSQQGMDAQSRAAFDQARNQAIQQEKSQRDAVIQNAAQRGISGSGLELASQLAAQQGAADRSSQAGSQYSADAANRQLQALQGMANQGAQVRSQDYSQAANAAQAQDAINKFNTQNSLNNAQYNAQAGNSAQAANLANAQNISNQNTAIGNAQQQYNKNLYQQNFENQYKIAQGASGQAANVANAALQGGQAVSNVLGGLGQAALGAGASIYANQPKQKNPLNLQAGNDDGSTNV